MITRKIIKRNARRYRASQDVVNPNLGVYRKFNSIKFRNPYPTGSKRQASRNENNRKKKTKIDESQPLKLSNKLSEKKFDENDVGLAMFSLRMLRHLPHKFEDNETPYDAVRNFFNLRKFESTIIKEVSDAFLRFSKSWMKKSAIGKELLECVKKYQNNKSSCIIALAQILEKHIKKTIGYKNHYEENFFKHFDEFFELITGKKDDNELYDLLITFLFVILRKEVVNDQNKNYFKNCYTINYKFSRGLGKATYSFEDLLAMCSILQSFAQGEAEHAMDHLKEVVDTEKDIPKGLRKINGHYVHATNLQLHKVTYEIIKQLRDFNKHAQKVKNDSLEFSDVTIKLFSKISRRIYPEVFLPNGVDIHIPGEESLFDWSIYDMLIQVDDSQPFDIQVFFEDVKTSKQTDSQLLLYLIENYHHLKKCYLSGFIQGFNANLNRNPEKAIEGAQNPSDYPADPWSKESRKKRREQQKDKKEKENFSTISSEDLKQIVNDNNRVMIFHAINEDKPFVDKKNKIKNIFCGKNTFKVHFMTTSNILQAMPKLCEMDEVNARSTYMVFIDSNQIISNMEMNNENWKFMTLNGRFEEYFKNCIKFPVVKNENDEEILKLKIYLTYQMIFLGINTEMAHKDLPLKKNELTELYHRLNKFVAVICKLLSKKLQKDLTSINKARVYSVKNQQDSRLSRQEHSDEVVKTLIEFSEYLDDVEEYSKISYGLPQMENSERKERLSEIKQTNKSLKCMWQRRELYVNYYVTNPVISDELAEQVMTRIRYLADNQENSNEVNSNEVKKVFFHVGLLNGSEASEKDEERLNKKDKQEKLRESNSSLLSGSGIQRNLFPKPAKMKDPEFKTPKAYKTKPRLTSTQNTPQRFLTPVQPSHKPSNSAFRRGFNDQDLREPLVSPNIQSPYVRPQFTSNSPFHYPTTSPGTPFIGRLNAQSRFEFSPQNTSSNPLKRPGTSVGGSTKKQRFPSDQDNQNLPGHSLDFTLADYFVDRRKKGKKNKKGNLMESKGVRRSSRKRKALGSYEAIPIKKERLQQLDQKVKKYRRAIRRLHKLMENIH